MKPQHAAESDEKLIRTTWNLKDPNIPIHEKPTVQIYWKNQPSRSSEKNQLSTFNEKTTIQIPKNDQRPAKPSKSEEPSKSLRNRPVLSNSWSDHPVKTNHPCPWNVHPDPLKNYDPQKVDVPWEQKKIMFSIFVEVKIHFP